MPLQRAILPRVVSLTCWIILEMSRTLTNDLCCCSFFFRVLLVLVAAATKFMENIEWCGVHRCCMRQAFVTASSEWNYNPCSNSFRSPSTKSSLSTTQQYYMLQLSKLVPDRFRLSTGRIKMPWPNMICQGNKEKQLRKGKIFAGSSRHVKQMRKFSDHFGVFIWILPSALDPSGIVHWDNGEIIREKSNQLQTSSLERLIVISNFVTYPLFPFLFFEQSTYLKCEY